MVYACIMCLLELKVCATPVAEKAIEILREVKGAQEAFRKQKDLQKLEAEV
jgi:hypothetical protein